MSGRQEPPPRVRDLVWAAGFAVAFAAAFLMLGVALASARPCARACRIMQPPRQTWICPDARSGAPVVRREVCYLVGWPEP